MNFLMEDKIVMISARSNNEELFPTDCSRWKLETFKNNIKKYLVENIITNLICLGDSHIEMDTTHILAKIF